MKGPTMTKRFGVLPLFAHALAVMASVAAGASGSTAPVALGPARITIAGTSNIHEYTASTTTIRLVRAELAANETGDDLLARALTSETITAFEIAIPAKTLTSPREGLDKNMHKALKVDQHADITFSLVRVEHGEGGAVNAVGRLKIAGVERDVTLGIKTRPTAGGLMVSGQTTLLMTDYGIKPP